ncbi:MAG: hypothetical protein CTY39_08605 [Hyphomicrobium sp.]|nr:MAG: hypothetical protein CTY39_08605 [Hyphomicrobium sp.]
MSNYIEQAAETTEAGQATRAHLRQACEHKIALHVDAACDVVGTDPVEADAWAYEAGKEAWEFDLQAPEKLASHQALSAAFKRGFDSVEQQARSQREVLKSGDIVTAQRAYPAIAKTGDCGVVVDAPAEMRCHPGTLVFITEGGYITIGEADVKQTGCRMEDASFSLCNSARLSGTLAKALADGVLTNSTQVAREADCNKQEFALTNAGYKVSPRDPNVNPGFPGAFMITDPEDDEDGFAIVGDDRAELITEAYEHLIDSAGAVERHRG